MYAVSRHSTVDSLIAPPARAPAAASFTPLEARVIALAASGSERPSTSVEPLLRRLARAVTATIMADHSGRELADPRLEALRSYAAAVRLGHADGLAVFHAAGYSAAHAALVKLRVAAAVREHSQRPPRRDRIMYASGISIGVASIFGFVAMTGTLLAGL